MVAQQLTPTAVATCGACKSSVVWPATCHDFMQQQSCTGKMACRPPQGATYNVSAKAVCNITGWAIQGDCRPCRGAPLLKNGGFDVNCKDGWISQTCKGTCKANYIALAPTAVCTPKGWNVTGLCGEFVVAVLHLLCMLCMLSAIAA